MFIGVIGVFFYQVFLGKLPVPSDALVGLYHPWRDMYAREFPSGVPFKNFLITDPVRQQIPWRKIAMDQWKEGNVPWWNPYSFSGTSLAGNIQAAVFYPFNVLFFLFSFPVAWTMLIIAQPLLAGIFLYMYLRYKQLAPVASLLGAITWSFSGFSVAWLTWGTIVQTALWLPLVLLSLEKVMDGQKRWWVVLAFALTMQFFAGHVQVALYSMVFSCAYWLVRMRRQQKGQVQPYRDVWKAIGLFILLTWVQWWPLARSIITSARVADPVWEKPGFFLPWAHLVQFVVPDFFGNPATLNYWGTWNWAELVGYVGIAPIVLATVALFSNWKQARFWAWTIVLVLVFALPTPLSKLPYRLGIPIVSWLQPTRLMVLIDFSLAVLAALGAQSILTKRSRMAIPLLVIGSVLAVSWGISIIQSLTVTQRNLVLPTVFFAATATLLVISLRWVRIRRLTLVLLVGLTILDLFRFGWKFTPFTPRQYFFAQTAVIRFLQTQPKPFRVMSMDDRLLPPNTAAYFGIETIEGYDPLYSARYEEFFAAVARGNTNITPPYGFNRILTAKNIDSPLLPFLGVSYILSLEESDSPFLTKVFEEGKTRLYRFDRAMPRVYIAEDIILAQSPQEILDKLASGDTVYKAVLETPVSVLSLPVGLNEGATIISYGANSLTLEVTAANSRLVVVLNQFDPNWKAEVDGKTTPIYRTNYIFQGVVVPPGSHVIRLYYTPVRGILF